MFAKQFVTLSAVLALASFACSVTFNFPTVHTNPGPTISDEILVESLDVGGSAKVELNFGAGQLVLSPGAGNLIEGTARYNVVELEPEIVVSNEHVMINTGDSEMNFSQLPNIDHFENRWDLQLGEEVIDLIIHAGAYEGQLELGGLALENLSISDGAADVLVSFSEMNPIEMATFNYDSGASKIVLNGLANANFSYMSFDAGLGDYTLDFSGELQQDAIVDIVAGLSHVVLIVPEETDVVINVDAGLAHVDQSDNWTRSGNNYSMENDGPILIINVDIGAGNLELKN